jgi:digeranylgeranylglycerophospholipid reductase
MPVRATKRGAERTELAGDCDVLICGASFAGLAVARELAGSGARVLIVDRYEIGERATSACGIPTVWLSALGLERSLRQTFGELVVHSPHASVRYQLPWSFSTFDYRALCADLYAQSDASFETATVLRRDADAVVCDRGTLRAPLIVDALGWRRMLASDGNVQPPDAFLSRGLEVHPGGRGEDLEVWIDRSYVRAGYGWSFPARDELRIGVGSFLPRDHVREPTARLADDLDAAAVRYQGNWIPHKLRAPVQGGVFFVGDAAGHCLPLTAEGIRPALYFGVALGRELRAVVDGRRSKAEALARYGGFHSAHLWHYTWMLRVQNLIPRLPPRLLGVGLRGMAAQHAVDWSFSRYLDICHPSFAQSGARTSPVPRAAPRSALPSAAA